ncbi:MAG: hypothetical protein HKN68_06130 [Saprospiraceae bacterium]|nr:hypothetical protein [Saprospiraceae bacterium]
MMEKIRLTVIACLLSFVAFMIKHDDIVMSPHLQEEPDNLNTINVQLEDFKTYGELRSLVLDNCMNEIHSRLILNRNDGYFGIKSKGHIIIDPLNTCNTLYRISRNNILTISDSERDDSKNINFLDSDKGIYNKLMFHFLNYGARRLYAERPEKAILKVSMLKHSSIETFISLMNRVAIQCEKLDENFPDMIPAFVVMFDLLSPPPPPPPPTISPPENPIN